ncbi:MAG: 4a-hydroxytetrahydrobiopterin dehydratase [Candidatus Zambryskibacteria bacterium]|nr:4a-hydroxytetrahydrobiopterin dehydratase [Candidatus Zambryskibacteria bacterium]
MDLSNKKCIPCEVGGVALKPEEVAIFSSDLLNWEVLENKKLFRKFKFKDFKESITFVNKVAEIAEKEGHHPDIGINYNEVNIELTTHAVGGLTENDFILVSKIDKII